MKRRLLLVEDDPDDRELTLLTLRENDLANEIVVAHDGAEALDLLFGHAAEADGLPVVTLLDLRLPKVDGLEVLRRIRADERTRLLPVVVLTSSTEERDLVETYALGANSYVSKPVGYASFTAAIRELGLYWLVVNRAP